jgi:acyl carrier protein
MGPDQAAIFVEFVRISRGFSADEHIELAIDTLLDDIPGIDSLRLLQAVAHLEQHFRVEIDVVDLDDLHCVRDIVNAISAARPEQCGDSGKPTFA